jgi:hypothetical protein
MYLMNPPFTELVIKKALEKAFVLAKKATVFVYLPNWADMINPILRTCALTSKDEQFDHGATWVYDYINSRLIPANFKVRILLFTKKDRFSSNDELFWKDVLISLSQRM